MLIQIPSSIPAGVEPAADDCGRTEEKLVLSERDVNQLIDIRCRFIASTTSRRHLLPCNFDRPASRDAEFTLVVPASPV